MWLAAPEIAFCNSKLGREVIDHPFRTQPIQTKQLPHTFMYFVEKQRLLIRAEAGGQNRCTQDFSVWVELKNSPVIG